MATLNAGIPTPPYQVSREQAVIPANARQLHQEPGVVTPNNLPQSYPYAPLPFDPRDTNQELKAQMVPGLANAPVGDAAVPGAIGNVQATYQLSQADLKYIEDKRKFIENAQYELWVYNQFDHTDPANARIFEQLFPKFYQRQRAYIDYCAEIMKRWAYIRSTGCRTAEDYMFKYLQQTGAIHIPKDLTPQGMTQNHPDAPGGTDQPLNNGQRGILNPLRWFPNVTQPVQGYNPLNRSYAFPTRTEGSAGISYNNESNADKANQFNTMLQSMLYGTGPGGAPYNPYAAMRPAVPVVGGVDEV
jgi:hypothetical protein